MEDADKIVWCIRALYGLTVTDAALSSFNFDGSNFGIFISQVALHFAFLLCMVIAVNAALPEALNHQLKVRFKISILMSIMKFGTLFVHFVPYSAFFGNFLFYAYLIDLSFACLSP